MTSIDTASIYDLTPEMPLISPTTSIDASISSDADADEHITTPPHSARPSFDAASSPQIVEPSFASSSKPKFNFASLNRLAKSPPSPGAPKFEGPSPSSSLSSSPPTSPSRKGTSGSTPYSRPAGNVTIQGLQRNASPAPLPSALRPMTPANPSDVRPHIHMPKSQPLSRALFSKLGENGQGQKGKPAKTQKLIVPKKAFQTSFELPLTSSEFARKDW